MHPIVIVRCLFNLSEQIDAIVNSLSIPIDINLDTDVFNSIKSCIGTKFSSFWGDLLINLSIKSCRMVSKCLHSGTEKLNVEIKRFIKIEKIPGGSIEDSQVLNGVMINKDIVHAGMRRRIENPRILLLDCPLEYKKAES